LPKDAFDGIRAGVLADRSKFFIEGALAAAPRLRRRPRACSRR
jgi:hypothetical protein